MSATPDYEEIAHKFARGWSQPLSTSESDFLALYSPDVRWYDHAFRMCHHGHAGIVGLRNIWLTCNKEYRVEPQAIHITNDGAVVEYIGRGTFVKGFPGKKGPSEEHGKEFSYHGVVTLGIDKDGKLGKVGEYYSPQFEEGVEEHGYFKTGAKI